MTNFISGLKFLRLLTVDVFLLEKILFEKEDSNFQRF